MSRFWRKNEKKLMKKMGMKATFGSGNTWIEKEDGENENFLVQAKSTKAKSISLKKQDILDLFDNAAVLDKTGVFVLDFVDRDIPVKLICFDFEDGMNLLRLAEAESDEL